MRWITAAAICVFALCACAGSAQKPSTLYDPRALPAGAVGQAIEYGHALIGDTPALMKPYVQADMACSACHIAAGTQTRGGSFIGVYARFPQWNKRAHRVIALQDRIAECFLYSMNGKAPDYNGREMIALVAYMAWLSRGVATGAAAPAADRYIVPLPSASPDVASGARLYAGKCALCHQSDGSGVSGIYPPLWGPRSFNNGAGMAHIDRMTGFVRYNMPADAPGSLSVAAAYDVAAFVLAHPRPHFRKNALVVTPSKPAKYF